MDTTAQADGGFRHEALMYEGEDGFLDGVLPFLRGGLAADEPMLVAVGAPRIERLRAELGADAERVRFADMAALGANPARIIPAWHAFVAEHPGRPLRGVGEPIWPGRDGAELAECHRHEALLNVAFAEAPAFRLMCPYDTTALAPEVVADACRTHPHVCDADGERPSRVYAGLERIAAPFDAPLEPPPAGVRPFVFDRATLAVTRELVEYAARAAGLSRQRREDAVLAVNELTTNSVRHGGGTGTVAAWDEDGRLVCEVRDAGRIERPLAGRERPAPGQLGGYGLWLVNQLCDLMQVRVQPAGNVVRVHVRAEGA